MKSVKPCHFDPLLALSYHDLSQEARRLRRANRRLRRAIRRLSEEEGDSAEFVLSNAPPMPKPWRGGDPENTRQAVLVAGMDCVAGQQDLFDTDRNAAGTPEHQ
jgi:hypothetical protein